MNKKSSDNGGSASRSRVAARRTVRSEDRALLLRRCRRARVLTEAGEHDAARRELSRWWPAGAERPRTKGLDAPAAAELLLCAGAIIRRLVTARQIKGAQALAKELLVESVRLFDREGLKDKAARARAELGLCLWQEGDFEGARRLLQQARVEIDDGADEHEAKASVVLSAAIVELDSGHPAEALDLLMESESLFLSCDDETLKGKYRINCGLVFKELAEETGRQHFLLRAVSEQKAAGYHLMQAKAKRLFARSENNLGLALFLLGYFDEAAERLGRAHELLTKFGEVGRAAQVKESQARLLLAWGRREQAVCRAAEAVCALEAGERPAVLAEALTTQGIALARVGSYEEARMSFDRAVEVAEEAGAWETAGVAALSALEELCERLDLVKERKLYECAAALLAKTHHYGIRLRLQKAADRLIAATHKWDLSTAQSADHARPGADEVPSLRTLVTRLSGSQFPLFVVGENDEDVQLIASIAHERSGRSGSPFVVIDCATFAENIATGVFLGGEVRRADGGTILFKNVQDLPRVDQARLLRLFRDGVVEYGRSKPRSVCVDVRVIAYTSCELSEETRRLFLPELFERLGGYSPLVTPSAEVLNELRELEGCLAKDAVRRCYSKNTKLPKAAAQVLRTPATDVVGMLVRHHKRTAAKTGSQDDSANALCGTVAASQEGANGAGIGEKAPLAERVRIFKMNEIRDALERTDGSITEAARILGMPFQTLQNMIRTPKYNELEKARKPPVKRGRRADTTTGGENPGGVTT